MTNQTSIRLRFIAGTVAVLCPAAVHIAIAMGPSYGTALAFAAAGALASGIVLHTALPARPWAGPAVSLLLLAALGLGAARSPQAGLLAQAGAAHAILYSALLLVFAATLRPGRTALVTTVARRINPHFHAGQVPYTRAVTWAWVLMFAGQLAASALLLPTRPAAWQALVTTLHLPVVLLFALIEVAIRRWRWRHEHATGLVDTIRGARRLMRQGARGGAPPAPCTRPPQC